MKPANSYPAELEKLRRDHKFRSKLGGNYKQALQKRQGMDIFDTLPTKIIEKGDFLLFPGEDCPFAFRTLSGCLRGYIVDAAGKEHIVQFAPEGWIISDLDSLINHVPARMFISALENSKVQLVPRETLLKMDQQDVETLKNLNRVLTNSIIASNKRLMGLLASTAEERYLEFLRQYPGLSNRISQKLIAAYIGITPQYLSEIKKKFQQGNSSTT